MVFGANAATDIKLSTRVDSRLAWRLGTALEYPSKYLGVPVHRSLNSAAPTRMCPLQYNVDGMDDVSEESTWVVALRQ